MNATVFDIIIQNAIFFGLSSSEEIHPDVAVRQLEVMASLLRKLPHDELSSFFEQLDAKTAAARGQGDFQHLPFLEGLPDNMGLLRVDT